jgi:hypothetical protein
MFTCTAALATCALLDWYVFVELLGFIALATEANLGTAQCVRNYQRKSTQG